MEHISRDFKYLDKEHGKTIQHLEKFINKHESILDEQFADPSVINQYQNTQSKVSSFQ